MKLSRGTYKVEDDSVGIFFYIAIFLGGFAIAAMIGEVTGITNFIFGLN